MMGLIKSLRRARQAYKIDGSIEKKNMWEADALYFIQGVVSVWADDEGMHKESYAMELLERVKEMDMIFKNHQKEMYGVD